MRTVRTVRIRGLGLPVLVATVALGMSACGDDDESTTAAEETTSSESTTASGSAEEIDVTATEYAFDLSATPTADTKSISVTNDGKEFHVMILARINEGFTVDEAIEMEGEKGSAVLVAETEIPPGKTEVAKVRGPIEPGDYAMICPVGGSKGPHYKLGQLEEFTIE